MKTICALLLLAGQAWGAGGLTGGALGGSSGGSSGGGAGTVTSVTAASPLSSSGGNTPQISLTGTIPNAAYTNVDNAWPTAQTSKSSWTFTADAQIALSTLTYNAAMVINFQATPRPILVLTGNVTSITLSTPTVPSDANGHTYTLIFCQDSTGSRTGPATWTNAIWPAYGTAPTLTTTAMHCDRFYANYLAYTGNYSMMPALNN